MCYDGKANVDDDMALRSIDSLCNEMATIAQMKSTIEQMMSMQSHGASFLAVRLF
jgi:hypothetical protein